MPDTPTNICDFLKDQDAIIGQQIGDPDYRSAATDYFCPEINPPTTPDPDRGPVTPEDGRDGGYSTLSEDGDRDSGTPDTQPDIPDVDDPEPDYDGGY